MQQHLAYHKAIDESNLNALAKEDTIQKVLGRSSASLYLDKRDLLAENRKWIYSQTNNPKLLPNKKCDLLERIALHQKFLQMVAPTIISISVAANDSYDTSAERNEAIEIGLEDAKLIEIGLERTRNEILITMPHSPCP